MELKNDLEKIGFSDKEAIVYLAILRLGKTTPAKIAKVTKLNRPTIYNLVKTLISKGVVSGDLADKSLHIVALPLESLKTTIEKSKDELRVKEKMIDEVIEELKVVTSEKTYSVPKIRFVEQGELKDFLYHNFDRWWKSVSKEENAMYGFQDHSFVENYQEWVEWAGEKHVDSGAKVKLFSNLSKIEKDLKGKVPMRDIRFLEESYFTSTTWAIGDYIVMIYTRQAPFYLVEIHDVAMAQNMREVFKTMWKGTRTKE
jgi:sugar-specific transcriptional regulator TrmB